MPVLNCQVFCMILENYERSTVKIGAKEDEPSEEGINSNTVFRPV